MEQYHTAHEKRITINHFTMTLEDVFGSIELVEPREDLDKIIEKAREEYLERLLEKDK